MLNKRSGNSDVSVNAVGTGPFSGCLTEAAMAPPPEYPRITYQTEGRTFDRLFKGTFST